MFEKEEYFFRIFVRTPSFNPKEETRKALVWILLKKLPPDLFLRRSILSIIVFVGNPIVVDKAIQDHTRPSISRVKVIKSLLEKQPNRLGLNFM